MTHDLTLLTAAEAAAQIASGAICAEDLARACLARIKARDGEVRAWSYLDAELVLEEARGLDRTPARGTLHGVPVGVKDVIFTADMPTQYNSELYTGFHPALDAACVSLLRSAGALIFGKTETVEFASTGRVAPTANPRDLRRTPGGSSSGSAAAVADGHVPVALGTQTGGSMMRPASFCGVYGVKPTWGLVSREGAKSFAPSLDTIGWFARSAQDLALLYEVFDPEPGEIADLPLAGLKIAVCRTPMWSAAGPATISAMARAAEGLKAAGAEVVDLDLPSPFEQLASLQALIMRAEGRASFFPDYRAHFEGLNPSLRAQVENADNFSRADLAKAYDLAAACRGVYDDLAAPFDAVLSPSTIGEAPMGLSATGDMIFNGMWTLLQGPVVGVPGFTSADGLPVGLSLTGPRFSDRKLLAVAAAVGPLFAQLGAAT